MYEHALVNAQKKSVEDLLFGDKETALSLKFTKF